MSADMLDKAIRVRPYSDAAERQRRSRTSRNLAPNPTQDREEPWREQAACRGLDPALFWPALGDNQTVRKAKQVCAGCPVRSDCLEYALERNERGGIWGGLSDRQRRRIRRKQAA